MEGGSGKGAAATDVLTCDGDDGDDIDGDDVDGDYATDDIYIMMHVCHEK